MVFAIKAALEAQALGKMANWGGGSPMMDRIMIGSGYLSFRFSLFAGMDASPMALGGVRPPFWVHDNKQVRWHLHLRPPHSYRGALCVAAPPGPYVLWLGLLG